jgi:hypothetical protein
VIDRVDFAESRSKALTVDTSLIEVDHQTRDEVNQGVAAPILPTLHGSESHR